MVANYVLLSFEGYFWRMATSDHCSMRKAEKGGMSYDLPAHVSKN